MSQVKKVTESDREVKRMNYRHSRNSASSRLQLPVASEKCEKTLCDSTKIKDVSPLTATVIEPPMEANSENTEKERTLDDTDEG
ncbi:unnamed protein product [Enterobius vermicularis]|uniref:Uncharacterized protein n=1 Tax=Enterobius vermicularis TaxID=51028 RepID=A0A0N4UT51_ENTVE|nr:unnamed protein product [Enterobius vermicularis]